MITLFFLSVWLYKVRQKVTFHHVVLALFYIDTNQMNTFHTGKAAVKRESNLVGQKVLVQPQGGSGPNQGKWYRLPCARLWEMKDSLQ